MKFEFKICEFSGDAVVCMLGGLSEAQRDGVWQRLIDGAISERMEGYPNNDDARIYVGEMQHEDRKLVVFFGDEECDVSMSMAIPDGMAREDDPVALMWIDFVPFVRRLIGA